MTNKQKLFGVSSIIYIPPQPESAVVFHYTRRWNLRTFFITALPQFYTPY